MAKNLSGTQAPAPAVLADLTAQEPTESRNPSVSDVQSDNACQSPPSHLFNGRVGKYFELCYTFDPADPSAVAEMRETVIPVLIRLAKRYENAIIDFLHLPNMSLRLVTKRDQIRRATWHAIYRLERAGVASNAD